MIDYLFIVYSHKKNLNKAKILYDFIKKRIIPNCKCYLMYGDTNMQEQYKIIDDEILIINTYDEYEYLNMKTKKLLEVVNYAFPNIKGMIKCDDDIIINMNYINNFFTNLTPNIDYCGGKVHNITKPKSSGYHISKVTGNRFKKKLPIPPVKYCGGPMYYLSLRALQIFRGPYNVHNNFFEDVLVGLNLNKYHIYPAQHICLWSENINQLNSICYHNYDHKNLDNRHV